MLLDVARVVLNPGQIEALLKGRDGPVAGDLQRRVLKVHAAARRFCPVDTDRLRSSIRWSITKGRRGLVGVVGSDAEYAAAVHEGTRPHVIESKGPWPLRNRRTGQVFGRIVHHPGTTAQPFLKRALEEAR